MSDFAAKWEHGYRCHGLWINGERMGFVGIGPRNLWTPADGYSWGIDIRPWTQGRAKTLRQAKRAVEKLIQV